MRIELDKFLCAVAPKLYAQRHGKMTETAMCWGFPGDGWFSLLLEASEELEKLDEGIVAVQVKEKFGTLRFYINGGSPEAEAIIRRAENRSCLECEICGAEGTRHGGGWLSTECNKCAKVDKPIYRGEVIGVEVTDCEDDGEPMVAMSMRWGVPDFRVDLSDEDSHRTLMEKLTEMWVTRQRKKCWNRDTKLMSEGHFDETISEQND